MVELNTAANNRLEQTPPSIVREYDIGGRNYIVKSIFVGDKDIKTVLLKLAEKKAVKEMGLDSALL